MFELLAGNGIFLTAGFDHPLGFFGPLLSTEGVLSLLTLTLMEIVLGIDNVIFISIISARLPESQQNRARTIGLGLALIMRISLLSIIAWIVGLKDPLFHAFGMDFSYRDIILTAGGLFLIYKSTTEIHEKLEEDEESSNNMKGLGLYAAIAQIVLLDIVFSFDSILTAVGLVDYLLIMIVAVIISLVIMLLFSKMISDFVNNHPTVKMLALTFLLMIGILLILEGFHRHVPKGYVYFAMAFSLLVEFLNLRAKKKSKLARMKSTLNHISEDHTKPHK